ncbi:protein kinase apk1b chloroplastic [Phtheirospermum japonicum]|uniref:Protein kinase apk1b chloroplastic n=1 Tax=Phtheirospermum japonicum TaxID=374723 RepID=A0A830DDY2_9LAMI|nr:protein kinase apk1b chloroplastic [Phtheirospermum japonicum]
MELEDDILSLSYEDLVTYTDDFSESNYLGHFQFGEFYRGKIVSDEMTRYVMVKIWEFPEIYNYRPGDNEGRLMDEVTLLRHEMAINRPGLARLYGYCLEIDHLGVVYDFKPLDSVYNLVLKDDFTWLQRIKVILVFAYLLKFLHTRMCSHYKSFIVRNVDCAHLVLDEDYNPKLCDFGLITGGIFPDRTIYKCHHVLGSYGYIDLGGWYADDSSDKKDVFAFGTILLSLISKRVYTEEVRQVNGPYVSDWAWSSYTKHAYLKESKNTMFSLVNQSLAAETDYNFGDGPKITRLALKCINTNLAQRPTMKQVLRCLLKLKVVKKNADFLGVNKLMHRSCENM